MLFENHLLSSSMLSSKNNRVYSKKCAKKQVCLFVCFNEIIRLIIMKAKKRMSWKKCVAYKIWACTAKNENPETPEINRNCSKSENFLLKNCLKVTNLVLQYYLASQMSTTVSRFNSLFALITLSNNFKPLS